MRKILSAILTAMIIVSSVSVLMFTSFAATNDLLDKVDEYGASSTYTPTDSNLLSGVPYFYPYGKTTGTYKDGTTSTDVDAANKYFLTNGNLGDYFNSARDGRRYYNGLNKVNDVVQSTTDSRIVLHLGKNYQVDTFLLASSKNQYPVTKFEIYLGNDMNTLFNEANKFVEYTRQTAGNYQYLVKLREKVSYDYFGIKFLEVDTTVAVAPTDQAIYLTEIAAYGTIKKSTFATPTALSTDKLNRISGDCPEQIINFNNSSLSSTTTANQSSAGSLRAFTNSNIETNLYSVRMINANRLTSDKGLKQRGMKMTYDLGKSFDITDVILATGESSSRTAQTKWVLYASDTKEDLYYGTNVVAYVEDDRDGNGLLYQQVSLTDIEARYIGFEFVQNYQNNETVHISEIAVYGNPLGQMENSHPYLSLPQKSVIGGTTTMSYVQGKSGATWSENITTSNSKSVSLLFDESYFTGNILFYNGFTTGYKEKFRIELSEEATVGSVLVTAANTTPIGFEAYVSNDKDTLFDKDNLFAVCDQTKTISTQSYSSGIVYVDEAKTGKYFGIAITKSYDTNNQPTIYEIAFFEPIEDNADAITTTEGGNLLVGKNMYWMPGDKDSIKKTMDYTTPRTTFPNASGASVSLLTDGNLTNSHSSNTDGTGVKIWHGPGGRMVYDMEKSVDIAQVIIASGQPKDTVNGNVLYTFAIYASNNPDTIFDPANQVGFTINDSADLINKFNLVDDNVKGRYLGILFLDAKSGASYSGTVGNPNIYLTEIAVYGNYTTDKYDVTHEPSEEELALKGTNALANVVDDALLTDGVVLTDDAEKAVVTEDADGTKLTYNMGGVMNITSLLVGGLYNSEKSASPAHYRIYLSNDESTLYTDESLVVDYYSLGYKANSGNYAGSTQLFDLTTAAKAQYVGFEFVTAALGSTTLSLSELAVYATYDMTDKLLGTITSPEKVYLDGVLVAESVNVPADVLSGDHSLVVQNGGSNNVYIVNNGVFTHKSELDNALSTEGTQIRTDDPLAIRFVNNITVGAKAQAIKYGAVVAKTAALGSKDLLIDSTAYATVNAVAYEKDVKDIIFKEDSATVSFTAAIHNIGAKQHLTYYAVRPYMVVSVGGKEYTVYGEAYESRVYEVAKAALADSNANYSEKVMTYLNNIVNNSSLTSVSQALYTSYGLTNDSVAASVKNTAADNDRLIKVIQKAMRGEEITLGVLGGSITMGANVLKEDRYAKSYAGRLREWLENTFDVKVNLVNAGIGATTSTFGVHRIEKDLLQHDPDLVVLEYAVNETENDTTNKTYEDCVRRILEHRNADGSAAALMLLFTVRYNNVPKTGVRHTYPENAEVGTPAYYNNQDAQMVIGNNYNLPMISYMDCIVPLVTGETPVLEWKGSGNKAANLTTDDIHPSYFGHQIISSLLSDYIATVAEDVTENTEATVSNSISTALYGATFTNAKFYNSCDLPEEWITSMGSFHAVHDICNEYIDYDILTHGWKAYSTEEAKPMVLDIPGAKTITLLMVRTKKIADGIKINASVTEPDGTVTIKNASNWLNSSNYADTTVVYTAEAGKDLTVELAPNFNGLDGEIVLLGVMVGFDEK